MRSKEKLLTMAQASSEHRLWYEEANVVLYELARKEGFEFGRFIDVLALISPRVHVKKNLNLTIRYMHAKPIRHIPSVLRSLEVYEQTGVIRGPKTSAFARALKLDPDALVMDTWMAKALMVPEKKANYVGVVKKVRPRMEWVCRQLDWSMIEAQAAIWTTIRGNPGGY